MISIIGAGPVGNYTAFLLAKSGKKVQVFEEHSSVGKPVQCTGIVSSSFKYIIKPKKEFVINEINKTRIYSPNGKSIELKIKTNYILDREKFDSYLAEKAKKEGAEFYLNSKFIGLEKNKIRIKQKNKIKLYKTDYLIGADGPLSQVANISKLFGKRRFLIGSQVRVKLSNDNTVEFYPFIGNFAWVVPEDKETVRIGVASYKKTNLFLNDFLQKLKIKDNQIIEKQSGVIPIYNPWLRTQQKNIFLIGDAATQVKATSGGGIVQGLIAAECLSESIIQNKNYQKVWKKKIGIELYVHLIARRIMDNFKDKDWNNLTKLCSQQKIKKLLYEEERDNLVKLGFRMAIKEPKLLTFFCYLFQKPKPLYIKKFS
ncbi:NAD(P)/FAD-dependent oxidoreductase [Candidatus Woesearchaeota archaeon]|nr:NAD(P)/FAD-dependent oxidoreductase [Candidatus Woesearchaeota archaeon]